MQHTPQAHSTPGARGTGKHDPLAQIGENATQLMASLPTHSHHRAPLLKALSQHLPSSTSRGSSITSTASMYGRMEGHTISRRATANGCGSLIAAASPITSSPPITVTPSLTLMLLPSSASFALNTTCRSCSASTTLLAIYWGQKMLSSWAACSRNAPTQRSVSSHTSIVIQRLSRIHYRLCTSNGSIVLTTKEANVTALSSTRARSKAFFVPAALIDVTPHHHTNNI